jgi:hypothetical protein
LAIKPRDNEAFYREVDEELRREQLTSYWQRYGKLAIGGVVLLLALLAGFIWWQNHKQEVAGKQGNELTSAFDDIQARKLKEAAPKLDKLAAEGSPGYRAAALMTKADLAVEDNKMDEAAAAYGRIADNADLPQAYRDLALVRRTHIEYDKLQPAEIVRRLSPLAKPESAWFGSAGEMVAIAQLKLGKRAEAARIFAALAKDENVPESLRSRSVQMAGSLGVDAVPEPSAAATKE